MTVEPDDTQLADDLTGTSDRALPSRQRILLWVAAARFPLDEMDAFEYVFEEPQHVTLSELDVGIDAALVLPTDYGHDVVLVIYNPAPGSVTLLRDVKAVVETLGPTATLKMIATASKVISDILARAKVVPSDDKVRINIVVVAPFERLSQNTLFVNESFVLDQYGLENMRNAVMSPGPVPGRWPVPVDVANMIDTVAGRHRIVIAVVAAKDIVEWPDIDTRRLFDLNIRLGLGMNRVRESLDQAFSHEDGQAEILAYHNGLTVLANSLTIGEREIVLSGISVVNGAQSVIALYQNSQTISPDLRLLVKFVEIRDVLDDAQRIAVRSNSQNPVTTRNLRALDETQLRLRRELFERGYDYQTRPNSDLANTGETPIQNDTVAQLLCSIYLAEPWLAVKRTELFSPRNYARVFPDDVNVERVLVAIRIREVIENYKQEFPEIYHRAWSLSAITACFVAGQVMRTAEPMARVLFAPVEHEASSEKTSELLSTVVRDTVRAFENYNQASVERLGYNNYYVEFKSKKALLNLAAAATSEWIASGGEL